MALPRGFSVLSHFYYILVIFHQFPSHTYRKKTSRKQTDRLTDNLKRCKTLLKKSILEQNCMLIDSGQSNHLILNSFIRLPRDFDQSVLGVDSRPLLSRLRRRSPSFRQVGFRCAEIQRRICWGNWAGDDRILVSGCRRILCARVCYPSVCLRACVNLRAWICVCLRAGVRMRTVMAVGRLLVSGLVIQHTTESGCMTRKASWIV